MDFNMWFIFTSLLLVSAGARRIDQGPQTFYDIASDSSTAQQNYNGEVVVYLTPDQLRALEAGGAVIRSDDDNENEETDSDLPAEPQVTEEQEEIPELDENEPSQQEEEALPEEGQQEEEAQQEEQENQEEEQDQDIDFEEILRILNEEAVEEEAEEASAEPAINEPQIEEENTESPRNFSPRFPFSQQEPQAQPKQQQQGYVAPAVAKQDVLKSYSLIRYQPNRQRQVFNFQLQQQQVEANNEEEAREEPQTAAPQEKKKFKLIPYEVREPQEPEQIAEEPAQETSKAEQNQRLTNLISALRATRFSGNYSQRKNKLQSMLREYKVSPKYFQKQNGEKTETVAKSASALNNKKRLQNKSKQGKGPARGANQFNPKKSQKGFSLAANARPIPVPVLKNQKQNAKKSIYVPVQTEQRVNTKNVKTRANKAYVISRRAPENKKQSQVEVRYLRVGPRE